MANYITKEGMQRLRQRSAELIEIRSKVIKQVVEAREMGDLSENAEYHAARERQRDVETEYNHIKQRMGNLQVIDADKLPKDAVRFGARVTLKELAKDKNLKVHLVGIDEVYETKEEYVRFSLASPIGKQMIGKKIGEHFVVKAPIGDREFEVLDIK